MKIAQLNLVRNQMVDLLIDGDVRGVVTHSTLTAWGLQLKVAGENFLLRGDVHNTRVDVGEEVIIHKGGGNSRETFIQALQVVRNGEVVFRIIISAGGYKFHDETESEVEATATTSTN